MYIYSKGTFTPTKESDRLSDIPMKAVTSDECLEIKKTKHVISICSTQFNGLPHVILVLCGLQNVKCYKL